MSDEPAGASCPACGAAGAYPFFRKNGYDLVRCEDCRLVRVANPPGPEELARFYSFASGYGVEVLTGGASAAWLKRVAAYHFAIVSAEQAPGRLLDVGCGPGYFVAEAVRHGWEASGVDLNGDSVELARAQGLHVDQGHMETLETDDGSLDVVALWDSIEHGRDPRATLTAVHRLLRPGGLAAVSTPNLGGLYPLLSYPVGRLTGYWTHPEPPAHLFQFSSSTLASLLERTGFRVRRVVHDRSPLKYTLAPGGFRALVRHPARALYAAAFLPALLLGPTVRAGDAVTVIAERGA